MSELLRTLSVVKVKGQSVEELKNKTKEHGDQSEGRLGGGGGCRADELSSELKGQGRSHKETRTMCGGEAL